MTDPAQHFSVTVGGLSRRSLVKIAFQLSLTFGLLLALVHVVAQLFDQRIGFLGEFISPRPPLALLQLVNITLSLFIANLVAGFAIRAAVGLRQKLSRD